MTSLSPKSSQQIPEFLDVKALQEMFGVGRSKARLMMNSLPSFRVGNKDYITVSALNKYLSEHDEIPVKWPRRR